MNKFNCGIYKISSPSGNFYIGSSKNIKQRLNEHRSYLIKGKHHSIALQRAWDKYGDELEYKLIIICEPKDLLFYEQLCIDHLKPEYNIAKVAGSRINVPCSEETREKMRKINKGKRPPSWAGKKHKSETKEKMSANSQKRTRDSKGRFH